MGNHFQWTRRIPFTVLNQVFSLATVHAFLCNTRVVCASRAYPLTHECAAGQANQMAETLCPLERLRFSAEVLTVPQQHFGGVHGGTENKDGLLKETV